MTRLTMLVLVVATLLIPNPAASQLNRIKEAAAKAAAKADSVRKAEAKADSIKKAAKADSVRKAEAKADSARKVPAATGVGETATDQSPAAAADPKVWDNYDFVPGNKVLFYTDFSEDRVGNFARRLKYVRGPLEVVERDGVRMLRSLGEADFVIPLGTKLPERFTLEFDIIARNSECCAGPELRFDGGRESGAGYAHAQIHWHHLGLWILGDKKTDASVKVPDAMQSQLRGKLSHVRVLVDGPYFKMYTNERRFYNIPELSFKRDSVINVKLGGWENGDNAVFLAMIRVAESETDILYDALAANGRWATQGILFATGKAELQPESRPVLKEIATTLKEHADLTILIEGHTDNVGNAAANLTLSDARAAAVKAALVSDFGVAADRITTKGLGDTKPSAPNTTAEGRAQNRRVEVVKM